MEDWRSPGQATGKAADFPLPNLEVHNGASGLKLDLPPELLLLFDAGADKKTQAPSEKTKAPEFAAKPEAPQRAQLSFADTQLQAGAVGRDASGWSVAINYPDGKSRLVERDSQTHEAKSITTRSQEGVSKLVADNGRWFMEVQGMRLPFPGEVKVTKDGDVEMQTGQDGRWRIEKPDGSIKEEKENADGARISYDAQQKLNKITRKDGVVYEQVNDATIVESRPGAKPVTWTKQGDIWSADNGDKARKNLRLEESGALAFEDERGIKHSINARGLETLEGAGLGKIIPDSSNRVSEVETADGKKVRKYEYFDEKSTEIKSVTIVDKEKGTSTVYTRSGPDSKDWRSDRGSWRGEIKISADGVHSIKAAGGRRDDDDSDAGKWTSYHPDGRETTDVINADNSRASYDKQNNLVSWRSADGARIDRISINGQDIIQHYDPKIGTTINWTKGADGNWRSDSARFKDPRKDLSFNTNGELSYLNERGGRVQEHRDGSKQVLEKDGTKLDFDASGQITKATKGNLERTFIRDAGGIALVRDRNLQTKEERTIFERRPEGEENRKNIHISPQGDLSYQNPDGTAVIERASMLRLELDKDGDITRVVGPKGSREFRYAGEGDSKAVLSVTDRRITDKGEKVENWNRVANPDGTLSTEFRSVDEKGKDRKPRYNINVCADGEYEFRLATDKPGDKVHVEKLTKEAGIDGMPEGIEDARDALISSLESVMDKSRLEKNIQFMKKYEKRMMDQVELQLAAGLNQDEVLKETERSIVDTYYHCARLTAAQGQKELYGQKDRTRLIENILYLAQDPQDIKQGSQGTCWWESSWNVGLFQRNVGHAARMLADVALTGQYTSTAGPLRGGPPKTIKIPAQHVRLDRRDSGAGWTPENAKKSSQRSMVGMLIDQIGPPLGGQRGWGQSDGGWHSESRNILQMITGRDLIKHGSSSLGRHEKLQLLKTGGWTASGGGHMWGYSMKKESDGSWTVLRDDQYNNADRVIARVRNLKEWISGDVAADVRKQWRPSPRRKGDSNEPVDRSSFSSMTNYNYNPNRPANDRIAVVQAPRPVWQAEAYKRRA